MEAEFGIMLPQTMENLGQPEAGGFPGGRVIKTLPDNAGHTRDTGSITGPGRPPGRGHDNPRSQSSRLENPMGGGAGWATVRGGSRTVRHDWGLSTHTSTRSQKRTGEALLRVWASLQGCERVNPRGFTSSSLGQQQPEPPRQSPWPRKAASAGCESGTPQPPAFRQGGPTPVGSPLTDLIAV